MLIIPRMNWSCLKAYVRVPLREAFEIVLWRDKGSLLIHFTVMFAVVLS